jgi:hypothetical protein
LLGGKMLKVDVANMVKTKWNSVDMSLLLMCHCHGNMFWYGASIAECDGV